MHIYLKITEKLGEEERMVKQPQELRIEVSSKEEGSDSMRGAEQRPAIPPAAGITELYTEQRGLTGR